MTETPDNATTDFTFLVSRMDESTLDIPVEGFKDEPIPRILLWRDRDDAEWETLIDESDRYSQRLSA